MSGASESSEVPDRVETFYADNRWLRAGVALIPYVGGSIDALISTRASVLVQHRVEALLAELRAAASRLEESKVDRNFLETEDWADLVFRTFRAASETRDREKIRLYVAILLGAASTDREPELDYEAALSAIADLSPLEIKVARAIYRMQKAEGPDRDPELREVIDAWSNDENWPSAALPDRAFHLKRIERTGLIAEYSGSYIGYVGGVYFATPTFRRLMRRLEEEST